MSASIGFHIHESNTAGLSIKSAAKARDDGTRYANVSMRVGATVLNIFVDNIQDLERIGFEFDTLITEARLVWGIDHSEGTA